MSALRELAERCEKATGPDHKLSGDIAYAVGTYQAPDRGSPNGYWPEHTASLDAALALLDPSNDWRRLTPVSMSIYAASPYNAAAQTRYDGYGKTPALQLCAAFLKMRAAKETQTSATRKGDAA